MKWSFRRKNYNGANPSVVRADDSPRIETDGISIQLFGATGGTIVQFRKYDRKIDQHNVKLYIIGVDQNFSESFAKIVSMEMIR
jgi:hypothetical protein